VAAVPLAAMATLRGLRQAHDLVLFLNGVSNEH